jgi:penicillin amidase
MKRKISIAAKVLFCIVAIALVILTSMHFQGLNSIQNLLSYHDGILSKCELPKDAVITIPNSPLASQVDIDTLGIPHIYAKDNNALAYSLGYMHARDRYFQMQLVSSMVMGRLSENIGEQGIGSDKFWKMFDLEAKAKALFDSLSQTQPDLYNYLLSYEQGVNAYVSTEKLKYRDPLFAIWGCSPKPWKAYYSFLIQWYMSFDLTFYDDYVNRQEVLDKLPDTLRQALYPTEPNSRLCIIPQQRTVPDGMLSEGSSLPARFFVNRNNNYVSREVNRNLGSNNWVVGSSLSDSGQLFLCNDLHLFLTTPNIFYEAQLCSDSIHVYGFTIPGIPAAVIGHNEQIAWGLTSGEWDVTEQYLLKTDPGDDSQYLLDGKWKKMTTKTFEINVKDQKPEEVSVKYTVFGPYIKKDSIAYGLMWHPQRSASAIQSFWQIMRSSNWDDFRKALSVYDYPCQNFIYEDVKNNIGIICAGKMPIKPLNYSGGLMDGTVSPDWRYVPFDSLPQSFNPKQGYLFSANQEPERSRYFYSSRWYEDLYRPDRINELLAGGKKFDFEDMRQMQLDIIDLSVRDLRKLLIKYCSDEQMTDNWKQMLTWDGKLEYDDRKAIFYRLFRQSTRMASDELARKIGVKTAPYYDQFLNFLLRYDSVKYGGKEIYAKEYMEKIVKMTDSLYSQNYNRSDPKSSGFNPYSFAIEQMTFLPGLAVNVNDIGGSDNTINVNYDAHPVVRMIIEVKDGAIQSWMVNAVGQTGRINDREYLQQLPCWKRNLLHKAQFTRDGEKLTSISSKIIFSTDNK